MLKLKNITLYFGKLIKNLMRKLILLVAGKIKSSILKIESLNNLVKRRILIDWISKGKLIPPPHIYKEMIVDQYRKKYSLQTLIETGTYNGEMIDEMKKKFNKIISIEIGKSLYDIAVKKFKKNKNVTLICGDSGKIIKDIMIEISKPCLFWLDGHFSGLGTSKGELTTPILEELDSILNHHCNHIVLIDDARLFNGEDDYPNLNRLKQYVFKKNKKYKFKVENDIIRLYC